MLQRRRRKSHRLGQMRILTPRLAPAGSMAVVVLELNDRHSRVREHVTAAREGGAGPSEK